MYCDNTIEQRFRRILNKNGYRLRKSRHSYPTINDMGGYRIDSLYGNYVVWGSRNELDLDDVESFIADRCE